MADYLLLEAHRQLNESQGIAPMVGSQAADAGTQSKASRLRNGALWEMAHGWTERCGRSTCHLGVRV